MLARILVLSLLLANAGRAEEKPAQENEPPAGNPERIGGFVDALKNPGKAVERYRRAKERAEEVRDGARAWDDHIIKRVLHHCLFEVSEGDEAHAEMRALEALGPKMHPHLFAILGDPEQRAQLVEPVKTEKPGGRSRRSRIPEPPVIRACDLLGDAPPAAVIPLLAPFLDSKSDQVRKNAILAIGKTGDRSAIPHLRRSFKDTDQYVRSYALMGINWAYQTKSLQAELPAALYEDVQKLLDRGHNADRACEILFRFDPAKASSYFLSPAFFQHDSRSLWRSLKVLAEANKPAPRTALLGLIEKLTALEELDYPHCYTLGYALHNLGLHQDPADRPLILEYTTHPEERLAGQATQGLLASHGLRGYRERLWEEEDEKGFAMLSAPKRHVLAIARLENEVNNGGLSQYFFNSSGNHWKDALAGLKAVGAREFEEIFVKALQPFGEAGPSTNRERRMNQLSRLVRKDEELFGDLEDAFYDVSQSLWTLGDLYVIKHPDSFR